MTRILAFTLGTALAWVGHNCRGGCPAAAQELRADMWFVRSPPARGTTLSKILVVVDFSDRGQRAAPIEAILRQVNLCAGRDHIQVRERTAAAVDPT